MPKSRWIDVLENQRPAIFLWMPVFFGVGIAGYFAIPFEPPLWLAWGMMVVGGALLAMRRADDLPVYVLLSAVSLGIIGYGYAALRTDIISAPVLEWRYYGPVEGRVIGLDRSNSNAPRVLLDQVYLPGFTQKNTPERVRVSLQGYIAEGALAAGGRITLTGSLSPPGAPVEPQGFDFRRMAWFMHLGAVGYTRNPAIVADAPQGGGFGIRVFQIRMRISQAIRDRIPGQNGAFAAAILTGDRSGIDPAVMENLRTANLAHLLAISGLHMGMLSGFVFALIRYGLALVPSVALRVPAKKWAAGVAILAGLGYLLLSGANVATQRAFIMTVVVLVAVMLDRPAFTLRAVAVAALIVLVIKPYSLMGAGFQMSFAATTALIAVYDGLRRNRIWQALGARRWRYVKPLLALVMTSGVAGAATAPFSAYYFNQISQFGLLANLLAVPVMGLAVMPSAVIAGVLWSFGFAGGALFVMGKGVGWILSVAGFVAGLEGAVRGVKSGPPVVLALMVSGLIVLFFWRGRGKIAGVLVFMLALGMWMMCGRPQVLISDTGKLLGVMETDGRVLSRKRGDGYAARIWLENDGDSATQAEAFARVGLTVDGKLAILDMAGARVVVFTGKDASGLAEYCQPGTLMVLSQAAPPEGGCEVIDKRYLRDRGALSLHIEAGEIDITGSKDAARNRPWGY